MKKRGFTLIEILVALAIFGIITAGLVSYSQQSFSMFQNSSRRYEMQTDIIYTSNSFNEAVRESTAGFLLNKDGYDPSKVKEKLDGTLDVKSIELKEQWNYIGLNHDSSKIYKFIWNPVLNVHIPLELTLSDKGNTNQRVKYKLDLEHGQTQIYKKIDQLKKEGGGAKEELHNLTLALEDNTSVLHYTISGMLVDQNDQLLDNKDSNQYETSSIVDAINSKQVIDKSYGQHVTAIAYRTTPIDTKSSVKVRPAVALVLDFSGSMNADMNGDHRTQNRPSEKRISHLKTEYIKLVERLAEMGDVELYVVPFSDTSFSSQNGAQNFKDNQPFQIQDVSSGDNKEFERAKKALNSLYANHNTNYGDGVREGLNFLKNASSSRTYLLVLSDGEPTQYNGIFTDIYIKKRGENKYKHIRAGLDFNTGDVIAGTASETETQTSDGNWTYEKKYYDQVVSVESQSTEFIQKIIERNIHKPRMVHLVGFSNVKKDNDRLKTIKTYFNDGMGLDDTSVVISEAGSEKDLKDAFGAFAAEIVKDLWYFDGP